MQVILFVAMGDARNALSDLFERSVNYKIAFRFFFADKSTQRVSL